MSIRLNLDSDHIIPTIHRRTGASAATPHQGRVPAAPLLLSILASLILVATPAAARSKHGKPSHTTSAATPTPAATQTGPARATSSWRGGPVPGGDAKTAYCAVEAEFSNGITLSIARSRAGAVTMAMLIPNLRPTGAASWPVTVTLDSTNGDIATDLKASIVDAVAGGAIVAIPLDTIADPQARLSVASTLTVMSANDRAAFALPAGTARALTQLTACTAAMS